MYYARYVVARVAFVVFIAAVGNDSIPSMLRTRIMHSGSDEYCRPQHSMHLHTTAACYDYFSTDIFSGPLFITAAAVPSWCLVDATSEDVHTLFTASRLQGKEERALVVRCPAAKSLFCVPSRTQRSCQLLGAVFTLLPINIVCVCLVGCIEVLSSFWAALTSGVLRASPQPTSLQTGRCCLCRNLLPGIRLSSSPW